MKRFRPADAEAALAGLTPAMERALLHAGRKGEDIKPATLKALEKRGFVSMQGNRGGWRWTPLAAIVRSNEGMRSKIGRG